MKINPSAFRKYSFVTLVSVYLVILAGGIVRSTGSGMGCPDWPKCFGRYVPPTDINQLPVDYKGKYKVEGHDADFNPIKTWIEYINRLFGAISGIFVLIVLWFSVPYLKKDSIVFWLSLFVVFLFGLTAWLGKVVVDSNLSPVKVTFHMALAFVIVAILIYLITKTREDLIPETHKKDYSKLVKLVSVLIICTFSQIIIGTQVREEIDTIAASYDFENRELWLVNPGLKFHLHRFLGYFNVFLAVVLFYYVRKSMDRVGIIYSSSLIIVGLMVGEMVIGIALYFFHLPPVLQPLHLLFASILFGIEFMILCIYWSSKRIENFNLING